MDDRFPAQPDFSHYSITGRYTLVPACYQLYVEQHFSYFYTCKSIFTVPVHGTFTINNTLPTGGTNFNNFNDAYNYIKCGIDDDVLFNVETGTGTYNEQLIMIAVPGASAANTVTFKGVGSAVLGFALPIPTNGL